MYCTMREAETGERVSRRRVLEGAGKTSKGYVADLKKREVSR